MILPHITPRRVAPYLISGAYGAHILVRMWRLNRRPASNGPLHLFLLKNTDVILVLTGGPVVCHLAQRHQQRTTHHSPIADDTALSIIVQIAHQLRQVFTSLLLGLGIIKRKIANSQSNDIPLLVDRLRNVIAEGIAAVNMLDPPEIVTRDGREREREV
jgi:hypothetical protein